MSAARSHDVIYVASPDMEPHVRAAELPFVSCSQERYPIGYTKKVMQQLSKLEGAEATEFSGQLLARRVEAAFEDLPQVIERSRIDALVMDEILWNLGLLPQHMGLPYAHVSVALHFDRTGITPIFNYDWQHEETPEAFSRNREGLRAYEKRGGLIDGPARAYAEKTGMKVDWADPHATISKLAWLTQTPKEFDFKSSHWPAQFHHTGPFHDGMGRVVADFPWHRLTGEPLIHASMGTLSSGSGL